MNEREELIDKMKDIYTMEVSMFGTCSFDINRLDDMSLEELRDLASKY